MKPTGHYAKNARHVLKQNYERISIQSQTPNWSSISFKKSPLLKNHGLISLRPSGSNGEISGAKQTDSHGCETAESARKADRKAPIRKLNLIQTVEELRSSKALPLGFGRSGIAWDLLNVV